MENQYYKNLTILKELDSPLYPRLETISENKRYRLDQLENGNYKIFDTQLNIFIYTNDEDTASLEHFKHYREYLYLYLFGLADGRLISHLLENVKHQQIIVIEPEIELIYIVLHLIDASDDMQSKRLIILQPEDLTFQRGIEIVINENVRFYAKVFYLHSVAEYYLEHYLESYRGVLEIYLKSFEHVITAFGNNIQDAMLGLRHHIKNLYRMIEHPRYRDFIKHQNSKLAVVVSTGPSLAKQLPLLKEAAPYITIISVDASFPILVRNGIKPDIVVSMERDEPTAKFFQGTTQEEQEGIIFICASLQHQAVFDAIKGGTTLLAMRPLGVSLYFDLQDYGYVGGGMSAANMAHEIAFHMGYEKCAFIGQDLAYGKDGTSHSKGHVFGEEQIKDGIDTADNNAHYETILIPAYGGDGMVESMIFWEVFLRFIEQTIEQSYGIMETINATEGGARIHGSTEMPFAEVLKLYALDAPKKEIHVDRISAKEHKKNLKKVKEKLTTLITEGAELQHKINQSFILITEACKVFENISIDEALEAMDTEMTIIILDEISSIRETIMKNRVYRDFFASLAQSMLYQQELDLAEIKVHYIDNPRDNQIKAIQWILAHRYWLFTLSGIIHNALEIINTEAPKEIIEK
jgi:hypothetical protein